MSDAKTVAFIGLGVMGYPMAGHLHRVGHKVRVYNRTVAKSEKFVAEFPGAEGFSNSSRNGERRGVRLFLRRQ